MFQGQRQANLAPLSPGRLRPGNSHCEPNLWLKVEGSEVPECAFPALPQHHPGLSQTGQVLSNLILLMIVTDRQTEGCLPLAVITLLLTILTLGSGSVGVTVLRLTSFPISK